MYIVLRLELGLGLQFWVRVSDRVLVLGFSLRS